jgi:hypothetical protein
MNGRKTGDYLQHKVDYKCRICHRYVRHTNACIYRWVELENNS